MLSCKATVPIYPYYLCMPWLRLVGCLCLNFVECHESLFYLSRSTSTPHATSSDIGQAQLFVAPQRNELIETLHASTTVQPSPQSTADRRRATEDQAQPIKLFRFSHHKIPCRTNVYYLVAKAYPLQ